MRTSKLVPVFLLALSCAAAATAEEAAARRTIRPRAPGEAGALPFSGAVQVGETLYLSGMIGLDAERRVPATAEEEARNVLDQMREVLAEAGMTMDDLVFVQIFCADVALYETFNRIYRTYFERVFPARAFIGSGELLFGARFEVVGIAAGGGEIAAPRSVED